MELKRDHPLPGMAIGKEQIICDDADGTFNRAERWVC